MRGHPGQAGVQENVCGALKTFFQGNTDWYRRAKAAAAAEAVLGSMRAHALEVGVQENALWALRPLLRDQNSVMAIVAMDAVEVMLQALENHAHEASIQQVGLAILHRLAETQEGRDQVLQRAPNAEQMLEDASWCYEELETQTARKNKSRKCADSGSRERMEENKSIGSTDDNVRLNPLTQPSGAFA